MKKDEPEAVSTPVPKEKEEITDRDSKEGVSAPTSSRELINSQERSDPHWCWDIDISWNT